MAPPHVSNLGWGGYYEGWGVMSKKERLCVGGSLQGMGGATTTGGGPRGIKKLQREISVYNDPPDL